MRRWQGSAPTHRLAEVSADLEARLTRPLGRPAGRFQLGRLGRATAVDPAVWRRHVRYRQRRNLEDRTALVEHYAPHARRVAHRYYRSGEPREDLEQVALEGLVLALERFDPGRSIPFLGFATPTITGTIKRFYRDAGWGMRVPRRVHDLAGPIREAEEALAQDLGRRPAAQEVADWLALEVREVEAVRAAQRVRSASSFDVATGEPGNDGVLGAPDEDLGRVEDRAVVQAALLHLADDRRELLGLYFEDGLTQDQIAARLGVSQMQVSRLLRSTLDQLRSHVPQR